MRYLMIMGMLLVTVACFAQKKCPQRGNSTNKSFQYNDSLKNRTVLGDSLIVVSLDSLLKGGDDRGRFSARQFIQTTGYVQYMRPGDAETCNCLSKDPKKWDLHLFLSTSDTAKDMKSMLVVEFTPYSYRRKAKYHSLAFQKSLLHKKVTVTGWVFWDYLHFGNAVNTAPYSKAPGLLWRKTCWEIHPVTDLVICNDY
jgi:hypothetical protein